MAKILEEGLHDNHLAILQAHYSCPEHTATWQQLADFVGYQGSHAINLQYGHLAKRVAKELKVRRPPHGFWLYTLVDWADGPDPQSNHTRFRLRNPVISALRMHGLAQKMDVEQLADEAFVPGLSREGFQVAVLVNRFERSRSARRKCLRRHGTSCCICGFDFEKAYGPDFAGLIHVHHITPIAKRRGPYEVDPDADLRPVCPNCHAVIHSGGACRSVEEVKDLFVAARASQMTLPAPKGVIPSE